MAVENIESTIERLINQHGNDVLRVSFLYLKDKDLAEDAFQEVFIKVFKNYADFRSESSEKTWILRITINVCKDMLKSKWMKNVSVSDDDELNLMSEAHINNTEEEFDKKELFKQVLTLGDKYKDVIILYYYEGYEIKEIAELLNTTVGNVSSLLSRAKEKLRNIVR